jgi:nucleotide-binding universal stress UspA family protein
VEEGEPAETILQVAGERGCDLVVMGRRGLKRIEYVLIGSTTRHLVERGSMEVLIMPLGSGIGLQSLLLALDAVPRSPAAQERAIQLAKIFGGMLHIVLAKDPAVKMEGEPPAIVEAIKRKAEARGVHAEGSIREGKLHEAIARMARETSSSLIVIGKRAKTGLEPLFPKGEIEKIVSHSQVPVLVVP